jgi:Holliday junction DNA helicase RuvA
MIAYLRGTIQEKSLQALILDVNGVGYDVLMSNNSIAKMPAEGQEAAIYTYLHVREDLMQLFGFCQKGEKELFEMLISVSGIGPKVALAILSVFSVEAFQQAVQRNDIEMITAIPGIGKKSAQRLVLELKDKITLNIPVAADGAFFDNSSDSVYSEARAALISLGYSPIEAASALEAFVDQSGEATAEDLIKYGLRNLSGG